MPRLEVFVSHRTVEARFADALCANLTHDFIGIPHFFASSDVTSVPAGSEWRQMVSDGLHRAHVMFAICSPQSVHLPWINYEAGSALIRQIPVIPLCHSGMTMSLLPATLQHAEALELTDPKGIEKLYARISDMVGARLPEADFAAIAETFKALESEYARQMVDEREASRRQNDHSIVEDPHVMCVSSSQYVELGLANELQTVLDAFPKGLTHDVVTSSDQLMEKLGSASIDVVHIAAFVCPRSGTLYFSHVDLPRGRPEGAMDFIRAEALAMLLQKAGTRLVVIASGDSLALATTLLPITNVISPRNMITTTAMANWVRAFYAAARTQTIAAACEIARVQSGAAMRLLTQQVAATIKMEWDRSEQPVASESKIAPGPGGLDAAG